MYVVYSMHNDTGDSYVNGPFPTRQAAYAWAWEYGEEKMGEGGRVDGDDEMLWVFLADDDEPLVEMDVKTLIQP